MLHSVYEESVLRPSKPNLSASPNISTRFRSLKRNVNHELIVLQPHHHGDSRAL